VLDQRNQSLADVLAMPEQDAWRYDGGNRSLVCSSFVVSTMKAAGLFPGLDFQATETQPLDTYLLQVFDPAWNKPAACAAQQGPDCQIMGACTWLAVVLRAVSSRCVCVFCDGADVLDLPGVNTVPPHDNMFSSCPSIPPNYDRPANC
jgi:hypothetical protein